VREQSWAAHPFQDGESAASPCAGATSQFGCNTVALLNAGAISSKRIRTTSLCAPFWRGTWSLHATWLYFNRAVATAVMDGALFPKETSFQPRAERLSLGSVVVHACVQSDCRRGSPTSRCDASRSCRAWRSLRCRMELLNFAFPSRFEQERIDIMPKDKPRLVSFS